MQTFALSLEQLALGSLASLLPLSIRGLPGGFPSLILHLAAGFWGIAGAVALRQPPSDGREAAFPLFALGAFALVAARVVLWGHHRAARALLVALVAGGAWIVVGDAARLAARGDSGAIPVSLVAASLVASALVLGASLATMILGHWYLIPPPLPFTHLVRGASTFLAACALRAAVTVACIAIFWNAADPLVAESFARLFRVEGDLVFVALRIFWGILGPMVLSVLVLRTARMKANQSATGLLYVSAVFVLIGELLANFLLVESAFPL